MAVDHSVTILLVEDDPGHARLIEKNLRRAGISNPMILQDDGQKAIDFIFGEGTRAGIPPPSPLLILLDLNMPVMDGFQVLRRIKGDERARRIPVVVLTTTDSPGEIAKCYELGCNVYVTKPVEYEQFCDAIRQLGLLLSIVKIPEEA
jgi:CheY-like chemotaxis protein